MAIDRKWVAQDAGDDNQWLKIDHSSRFIVNHSPEWQPLFGTDSAFTASSQNLKLSAQFDTATFTKIRIIGYLYNPVTGNVDSSASVVFRVFKVVDATTPKWDDQLIATVSGDLQTNSYYFKDIDIASLAGVSLDGDTTLMIEGVATRLGRTYRERIYVNHLGVYDSVVSLKKDVEFLDATKQDE